MSTCVLSEILRRIRTTSLIREGCTVLGLFHQKHPAWGEVLQGQKPKVHALAHDLRWHVLPRTQDDLKGFVVRGHVHQTQPLDGWKERGELLLYPVSGTVPLSIFSIMQALAVVCEIESTGESNREEILNCGSLLFA